MVRNKCPKFARAHRLSRNIYIYIKRKPRREKRCFVPSHRQVPLGEGVHPYDLRANRG